VALEHRDDPSIKQEASAVHTRIKKLVPGPKKTERLIEALKDFPDDKYLLGELIGDLLRAANPQPKALTPYIERLLKVAPTDTRALGFAIWHAGLMNDADRVWTLSVHKFWVHPNSIPSNFQLGELSRMEGRFNQAKYHFGIIIRDQPRNLKVLEKLRDIALVENDLEGVRRYEDQLEKSRRAKEGLAK
jgi:hypothetical protein